jgi:hypothetical protein
MRNKDGTIHFSDLKCMAVTPAHYKHACATPRTPTRPMLVGTVVDRALTGGKPLPLWEGQRKGNDWKVFEAAHAGKDIVTRAEYDDAIPMVNAVRENPLAMRFLTGRPQVGMTWEVMGMKCSTRGIDVVGDGWISDLKASMTAKPGLLEWHAQRQLWHAQLAWYEEGARQCGIKVDKGLYLVVIESKPPHPSTVFKLSAGALEAGRRCVRKWLEDLRACEQADYWPGYTDAIQDFDIQESIELEGLGEDAEDE